MYMYKMTPTRVIAHIGRFSNPLFNGSSLNRKFDAQQKVLDKSKAKKCADVDADETYNALIADRYNQSAFDAGARLLSAISQRSKQESGDILPVRFDLCQSNKATQRIHKLSTRSKYKIRDKIESLYNASKGTRFTFLTLTFIDNVQDKQAQKCLNKFLTVARKKLGTFLYLWVAERQVETGNIHFHLISNKRFPIQYFNALWVRQQYRQGLINDAIAENEIEFLTDKQIQKKLNPVDVKKINSIDGLSIYLTMYVTKNTDTFECSVWHCCRTVSKLFTSALVHKAVFLEAQQLEINFGVNVKTGEVYEPKIHVCDYGIVVNILNKKHFHKKLTDIDKLNEWILKGMEVNGIPMVDALDYHNIFIQEENYTTAGKLICTEIRKNFKNNLFDFDAVKPFSLC